MCTAMPRNHFFSKKEIEREFYLKGPDTITMLELILFGSKLCRLLLHWNMNNSPQKHASKLIYDVCIKKVHIFATLIFRSTILYKTDFSKYLNVQRQLIIFVHLKNLLALRGFSNFFDRRNTLNQIKFSGTLKTMKFWKKYYKLHLKLVLIVKDKLFFVL